MDIDFLKNKHQLRFQGEAKLRRIFDPVRRGWFLQTPEELVRQLLLLYLIQEKSYPKNCLSVEKMLIINGLQKRFDILVYDRQTQPHLLVECKAPNVPVTQDTFRQVAIYNLSFRAKYLLVTNGLQTFCCEMEYEGPSWRFLEEIPVWSEG